MKLTYLKTQINLYKFDFSLFSHTIVYVRISSIRPMSRRLLDG